MVNLIDVPKIQAKKVIWDAQPSKANGKDGQEHERRHHPPAALVSVFSSLGARLAQKGHRDLARGVKCGHERGKSQ